MRFNEDGGVAMWLIQLLYKLATVTVWFWGKGVVFAVLGAGYGAESFLIAVVAQVLISFVIPRLARRSDSALMRALFAPQWPKFRPLTESELAAFHGARARRSRRSVPLINSVSEINPATGLYMVGNVDVGGNPYGSGK
jgi:hypothetical protein